jgi:hypothetical protein
MPGSTTGATSTATAATDPAADLAASRPDYPPHPDRARPLPTFRPQGGKPRVVAGLLRGGEAFRGAAPSQPFPRRPGVVRGSGLAAWGHPRHIRNNTDYYGYGLRPSSPLSADVPRAAPSPRTNFNRRRQRFSDPCDARTSSSPARSIVVIRALRAARADRGRTVGAASGSGATGIETAWLTLEISCPLSSVPSW